MGLSRRDFLKSLLATTAAVATSDPIGIISKAIAQTSNLESMSRDERERYTESFNSKLQDYGLNHIEEVRYLDNTVADVQSEIERLYEKGKIGNEVPISFREYRNSTFICQPLGKLGEGKKPMVYAMDKAFKENPSPTEFILSLYHENDHGKVNVNGIQINGSTYTRKDLEAPTIDHIMELRANHTVLTKIQTLKDKKSQSYLDISEEYRTQTKDFYNSMLKELNKSYESPKTKPLDKQVIREHIIKYGQLKP